MNARVAAVKAVTAVLDEGASLATALPPLLQALAPAERGLAQELSYGTLRWQPRLAAILKLLLDRPLKRRDSDLQALLLTGLYQLAQLRLPPYAAVAETVAAAETLGKVWAKGLVNAVLRNYQRRADELASRVEADPIARTAHPAWLLQRLQTAWPEAWEAIVAANNSQAPMVLRVNARLGTREAYLERLREAGLAAAAQPHCAYGLVLAHPCDVTTLPGFAEGAVSVQDGAAQLAGPLLVLAPGLRVLDACAAPGGKTGQILELEPGLAELLAIDRDAGRLRRVADNLARLRLEANLIAGDAAEPGAWWDGRPFDRILLDAPCSATGVIRRHPDIKLLRRASDIDALAYEQARLLDALWPLLRPGGRLLYATCSILPEENERQIQGFIGRHPDAREESIAADWGHRRAAGIQILPGEADMDGFYYACLMKV